jgi:hypothetical protein
VFAGGASKLALLQGASYVGFSIWSFAARGHYRRIHNVERTDAWVLNAHGMWMLLVGISLTLSAASGRSDAVEVKILGMGAALGLGLNDALAAPSSIYRSDLLYEAVIAVAWPLASLSDAKRPRGS